MKTIEIITEEMNDLMAIDRKKSTARQLSKARKRVYFLTLCRNYLETSPTDEFLQAEEKRLQQIINNVGSRFTGEFATLASENAAKKEFNKKYDIPKYKDQLKVIRFLLK